MEANNCQKIKNFIEYHCKPFSTDTVIAETGLTYRQVVRILGKLKKKGMISPIAFKNIYRIYVRNPDYIDESKINEFGFKYATLRLIIAEIKKGNFTSFDKLQAKLPTHPHTTHKYINALYSIGAIYFVNGGFRAVKHIDLMLVGSKIHQETPPIMTKTKGVKLRKAKRKFNSRIE